MADKQRTQAMGDASHKGEPVGTGAAAYEHGGGAGGQTGPKKKDKPFRGGQSEAAYHGTGQLGEQPVGDGENPNAPARED